MSQERNIEVGIVDALSGTRDLAETWRGTRQTTAGMLKQRALASEIAR